MTNQEVIDYLETIAKSASLPNYKEALSIAVNSLKRQEYCCWCSPYLNGDLYLKTGEMDFTYVTALYCPVCGKEL